MILRPISATLVAYLIGIIGELHLKILSVVFLYPLLAITAYFFISYIVQNKRLLLSESSNGKRDIVFQDRYKILINKNIYILLVLVMMIGHMQAYMMLDKYKGMYKEFNKQPIRMEAIILTTKEEKDYCDIYKIKVIDIKNIKNSNKYKNTKLILRVKKEKNNKELNIGDKVNITGEILLPSTRRNEHGFDYSRYLYSKQIYAIFKSSYKQINIVSHNNVNCIYKYIMQKREDAKRNIEELLPENTAGVAEAIILR